MFLRVIVSVYVLLLVLAWLTENTGLWGVYHLTFAPFWIALAFAFLALVLVWVPQNAVQPTITLAGRMTKKLRRLPARLLTGFLMVTLFVAGRSKNHLLGDGYTVLANTADPDILLPTELLDILTHRLVYHVVGDAETSYLLLAVISGILFVNVGWAFVSRLLETRSEKAGCMVLFLGLAPMQFFFGYAENYTMMTASLCLFLYLGWRSALQRQSIWLALLAFIAAGLFHLSAWFVLPGMLFLFWHMGAKDGRLIYRVAGFGVAGLAVIAAALYYVVYEGEQVFVPIVANESNPYSLFSPQHITDIANLLLLAAPLPAFLTIWALTQKTVRKKSLSPQVVFLGLCCAGALLFTILVDPKIGAVRDWDLLSLYAVPAAFLSVQLYSCADRWRRKYATLLLIALAVAVVHTAPWVYSNTDPYLSLSQIKAIVRDDIHYTPEYYRGKRLLAWAKIMGDLYGDREEARRSYCLRVEGDPDDQSAWLFCAVANHQLGDERLCLEALEHVRDINQLGAVQVENLARLQIKLGDTESAKLALEHFFQHFDESFASLFLSGLVRQMEQDNVEACGFYDRAMKINPYDIDLLINYATLRIDMSDFTSAERLLTKAESLPHLTARDRADIAALRGELHP